MIVLLGGRVAEHVVFKFSIHGAADDLVKVTYISLVAWLCAMARIKNSDL